MSTTACVRAVVSLLSRQALGKERIPDPTSCDLTLRAGAAAQHEGDRDHGSWLSIDAHTTAIEGRSTCQGAYYAAQRAAAIVARLGSRSRRKGRGSRAPSLAGSERI